MAQVTGENSKTLHKIRPDAREQTRVMPQNSRQLRGPVSILTAAAALWWSVATTSCCAEPSAAASKPASAAAAAGTAPADAAARHTAAQSSVSVPPGQTLRAMPL